MKPKQRRIQLSLRALLIGVTISAVTVFVFWPKTKWIRIKHDEGAYVGGVPAPGDHVDVYVETPDRGYRKLASGLLVAERPDWRFKDGISMKLKVRLNWRQQWKINGYKYYRISRNN